MILVDTSVWIDHLRQGDNELKSMLVAGQVFIHPFVIGEIALGNLRQRELVLNSLHALPHSISASDTEVFAFIDIQNLFGLGIGFVDAHLLASARLSNAMLWTRDKRFRDVAEKLGMGSPAKT